jgi:hypothetical protein
MGSSVGQLVYPTGRWERYRAVSYATSVSSARVSHASMGDAPWTATNRPGQLVFAGCRRLKSTTENGSHSRPIRKASTQRETSAV